MRKDLKNSGTLKLCYLLFEILNSICEDLNICYVKGMVLTRAIKSFRMSVSNNHVLIVITKMLHYHYEKERLD